MIEWLLYTALTLTLASAATACIHAGNWEHASSLAALTFSASGSLFAIMLVPPAAGTLTGLALWSLILGLSASLPWLLTNEISGHAAGLLMLTATVMLFAWASTRRLVSRWAGDDAACIAVTAAVFNLCALPVFLGPFAENLGARPWIATTIVNLSPITHLASALDIDYLRVNWFYEHSRLGGLRFDTFSPTVHVSAWLLIALICQAFIHTRVETRPPQSAIATEE